MLARHWFTLVLAGAVALAALAGLGSAATKAAPNNTTEPTISGTPVVGKKLTATSGQWTGSPTAYTYQWVRCPSSGGAADGSDCAAISGATTSSYVPGSADVGKRLRVRVTATNADGRATAASNATAAVRAANDPANTAPPTISGTLKVGSTLTANRGTWSGDNLEYSYAWLRCDRDGGSCSAIGGANDKTYALKSTDEGNTLRVRVTAKNADGSTSATSTPTGVVQAATTPVANGCPTGTGALAIGQVGPPARLLVDGQQISPSVVGRSTGGVTVRFHVSACGGRAVSGAMVYATAVPYNQFTIAAEQPTGADGWATLTMRRLRGYPATPAQQLLVFFVRARKPGENVLSGISTRRLVSFPVDLAR
jgi:hypothetical protein